MIGTADKAGINRKTTITDRAAEPIMAKYIGVLAAADVKAFVLSTTIMIVHSTRLDFGRSAPIHP